jgi:hypothetical protein
MSKGRHGRQRPGVVVQNTLLNFGIACAIAAIVGVGLKAFGNELGSAVNSPFDGITH